jgi:hypothetical protein
MLASSRTTCGRFPRRSNDGQRDFTLHFSLLAMESPEMTAQQVDDFFQAYAAGFTRLDVDDVCHRWAYPAYFVYRGVRSSLSEAEFRTNTEALCRFYASQGMARATKETLDVVQLTETTATVRTADALYDAQGQLIAKWVHAYLLSDTTEGLRVVCAMPDEELEAWGERWPGSAHLPTRLQH